MEFNLDNVIARRETKEVYKDGGNTIKLFVENYSKANILNEALNQARVEEEIGRECVLGSSRWVLVG